MTTKTESIGKKLVKLLSQHPDGPGHIFDHFEKTINQDLGVDEIDKSLANSAVRLLTTIKEAFESAERDIIKTKDQGEVAAHLTSLLGVAMTAGYVLGRYVDKSKHLETRMGGQWADETLAKQKARADKVREEMGL